MLRYKPVVNFDANDRSHVEAIVNLIETGKQDKNLRFEVPELFNTAPGYAIYMMALKYAEIMLNRSIKIETGIKSSVDIRPVPKVLELKHATM